VPEALLGSNPSAPYVDLSVQVAAGCALEQIDPETAFTQRLPPKI
jgi:hypothetical protein